MESISEEDTGHQSDQIVQNDYTYLIQPSKEDIFIELNEEDGTSEKPNADAADEIDQVASSNLPDLECYGHLSTRADAQETHEPNKMFSKEQEGDNVSEFDHSHINGVHTDAVPLIPEEKGKDADRTKQIQSRRNDSIAMQQTDSSVETVKVTDNVGTNSERKHPFSDSTGVTTGNEHASSEACIKEDPDKETEKVIGDGHSSVDTGVGMEGDQAGQQVDNDTKECMDLCNSSKHSMNSSVSNIPLISSKDSGKESICLSESTELIVDRDCSEKNQVDPATDEITERRPGDGVNKPVGIRGDVTVESDGVVYLPMSKATKPRASQPIEGKESIFQQALSLMSERCVSRPGSKGSIIRVYNNRESVAGRLKDGTGRKSYPYGVGQPQYFYINQSKPTPMEPLKAWKGYSGNVYFQPITIQTSKPVQPFPPKSPDIEKCTPELQQILLRSRRSPSLHNASIMTGTTNSHYRVRSSDSLGSRRTISRHGNNQSPGAMSTKSSHSKVSGTNRGSVILDKKAVLTRSNENIEEDILWLAGQESTGSLCVLDSQSSSRKHQPSPTAHQQQHHQHAHTSLNRDRIRKGSMVRNMNARQIKRPKPTLSISGDKFTQAQKPSPLIRAQTQYSQSSQRALISPDGSYHSFSQSYEKLPPLEQLRASLKQLNNSPSKESLVQVISTEDRIRLEDSQDYKRQPLLKYSPELRFRGVPRQPPLHRQQIVK